jgi:ribosome biogenesis GTPase
MSREYDFEEDFFKNDRKVSRKARRRAQETDRSKFKKTDQNKLEKPSIDLKLRRARVLSITGEGVWVDLNGETELTSIRGLLKSEKTEAKNLIAVGDWVRLSEDGSIVHIEERFSFLGRTDISGKKEQLIAVNIDQIIIVTSIVNPPLKTALIDRYLIAAEKGNLHPIIAINKLDLLETASPAEESLFREFLSTYEKLGIPIVSISAKDQTGIDALKSLLKGKTSVFSGQSGVGKSSLLNAAFGLLLKTGGLTQKTAKGSHTTTSAELIPLPGGGFCVDTPGIKSFALWKIQPHEVMHHFKEFPALDCKFPDCQHINEPACAVLQALEAKNISSLRYDSYRTLLDEAKGGEDNRTKRKQT